MRPSSVKYPLLCALLFLLAGCEGQIGIDRGRDAATTMDAGRRDAAAPASDAGAGSLDASTPGDDAGVDAGSDAGLDAGYDAGFDAGPPDPGEPDLSTVRWLHTDVSGWPATATLHSVTFRDGLICLDYDRADVWPSVFTASADVVGNPWVFIERDGTWYGATWEWLRPGQHCKAMTSVAGDHIKQSPFDAASGWRPTSGQVLWFMVSGLARSSVRNTEERTNLVRAVWP